MNKSTLTLIPQAVIHPDKIILYNEPHWEPFKPNRKEHDSEWKYYEREYGHLLKSSRTAEGKISQVARKKIKKAINYLLLFASDKDVMSKKTGRKYKFKIAFITLTLPSKQIHSDNEIKRECLNQFLIEIKNKYKVDRYVWRAEKQGNGNIHFHIILDKFIHWNDIRNTWNRIVNKLGYVDRYRDNMKEFYKDGFKVRNELLKSWSETKQRANYKMNLETGWNNPNTTDVHSIVKIRNISAYFVKYMTKNKPESDEENNTEKKEDQQQGRVWGASKNLQNISGARLTVDSEIERELDTIMAKSDCKVYTSDYFTVLYFNWRGLRILGTHKIFDCFGAYLAEEFDYNYQTELFGT